MRVAIGVDLGQKQNPTAIAVAEESTRSADDRQEVHFLIRHLDRLRLGTPYPEVAARVAEIVEKVSRRAGSSPTVYVDATGVGQPVVDLFRHRAGRMTIKGVSFTHGDQRSEDSQQVKLGKAWLVSHLQTLLQQGFIHLPRTAESQALARELREFEARVDETANDRPGAFKVGTYDDLVTALGLAVQPPDPHAFWFV